MGKSTFSGPIRTGRRNTPQSDTYGHVMAAQKIIVSAAAGAGGTTYTIASRLPACDLVDITAIIQVPFAATAAAISHLKVGTTADSNLYGEILVLSEGVYKFGLVDSTAATIDSSALAAWNGISEGTNIVVTISAAVTALTSGRGQVYVTYYQTSAATV